MAFKTRQRHGGKHAGEAEDQAAGEDHQAAGEDLRDGKLDGDVSDMLEEIDCCLAGHAGQEAAGQAAEDAARAAYEAIRAACQDLCSYPGIAGCGHKAQMRVWAAEHGEKFFWCCGKPVFDKDEAEAMEAAGGLRGLDS